ncbi:MAG: helix-turn-helix transcriptional regulator [Clostridia bacterium]|nr:helix-turn-helix transcriptional regulator [Clostridia bacterium]
MIHAYDEKYLNDAMRNLGEAVDYAVNACNIPIDAFFELFIATGISSQFETGTPKIVSGMSGTELVEDVIRKSGFKRVFHDPQIEYEYSSEYWCGYIIAYYQWITGKSFNEIFQKITPSEIEHLYPTLHEASEDKFVDIMNSIIDNKKTPTKLQTLRKNCNYSQRELSEKSGVNLRTLQQYEAGSKDINKAASLTLLQLSRALGCRMEDLMD